MRQRQFRRSLTLLVIVVLLVAGVGPALAAAPTFSAPETASAESGKTVTITYTIANPTSDSLDQFSVLFKPPRDADIVVTGVSSAEARSTSDQSAFFVGLEPNQKATVDVTYFVKATVDAGTYNLVGELVPQDGPRQYANTSLGVDGADPEPPSGPDVALAGSNVSVAPGETATIEWTATNAGNASIDSMLVDGGHEVPGEVRLTDIRLTDGGVATTDNLALYSKVAVDDSRTATMDYEVAEDATPGKYTVTARAETNSGATATTTSTITVRQQGVVTRYDTNNNGTINDAELLNALADYGDSVSENDLLELLSMYEA